MNESRRRQLLQAMADHGDRHFDPSAGLLRLPMTNYRNVHAEHLDTTPRHPLRESLYYALVLLELAERSRQGRAETILDRVLALQDTRDPEAKTFGLWPYFQEEPVAAWPWPDYNWADFNGMTLLLIWHRHQRRLPVELAERLVTSLRRAALCIRRRNVDLNYTNIAIKGTFVTLSTAEITRDEELLTYAMDRLERLRDTVAATGAFAEYNSPTYAAVSLAGLHAIATYVASPRARELLAPLLARFWDDVASRFHSGLKELAGPHSRAYRPGLASSPGLLGALIEKASRGAIAFSALDHREPLGALAACVVQVDAPPSATAAISRPVNRTRQVVTRSHSRPEEAPRVQTTHLAPDFCLGSVSFQDGWEQRHNLIAYWKSRDGATGILRHRYLRDDRPCCSGYFTAAQQGGAVAVGAFLGAYADHHVSLPVDRVTASFLGTVLEIDTAGEAAQVRLAGELLEFPARRSLGVGEPLEIDLENVRIAFELIHHETAPGDTPFARLELAAEGIRVVLPHYEGDRRELRWSDFTRASSGYVLRIAGADEDLPDGAALRPTWPESVMSREETELWALEAATAPA